MKLQLTQFTTGILTGIIFFLMISCGGETQEATDQDESTETTEEETKEEKSEITLTKTEFNAGESIEITYKAVGEFDENAWIGIIPADKPHGSESDNDKYDVTYQRFKDTEGTLTFKAPAKAGEYDFRMHTSDSNGEEVAASEVFTVTVVEKTFGEFAEGVTVAAKWNDGAYYSAVITKVDGDKYDLNYDDGSVKKGVPESDLIMLDPNLELKVGDKVQAVWTTAKFYSGVIEKIDGETIIVKWDDGSKPSAVAPGKIFKP